MRRISKLLAASISSIRGILDDPSFNCQRIVTSNTDNLAVTVLELIKMFLETENLGGIHSEVNGEEK